MTEFIIWVDAAVEQIVLTYAEAVGPIVATDVAVRPLCRFSARTWDEAAQIRDDVVGLGNLKPMVAGDQALGDGWSLRRFLELESVRGQLFTSDHPAVLELYCNVVDLLSKLWERMSPDQRRQVRLFTKEKR